MPRVPLSQIAHGRSGDKGNHANVAVIAYTDAGFAWLREHLTADVVAAYFAPLGPSRVERFEAANVRGLNFVLYDVLAGGASRSLRTDTQGKTLALALLRMPMDIRCERRGVSPPGCESGGTGGLTPAARLEVLMSDLVLYRTAARRRSSRSTAPTSATPSSRALIAALTDAFRRAADDPAARCVILTGNGPAFCAGMDLDELRGTLGDGAATRSGTTRASSRTLYDLIYTLPKPTIAAVNGAAVAGGAGLVTVCDLAVSVPDAKFGYPEVRRGLVAAMVMPHLLRHVGERTARWLLLTGELIDARRGAADAGFVNAVVSPEQLHGHRGRVGEVAGRGRAEGAGHDEGAAATVLAAGAVGGGTGRRRAPSRG